MRVIVMFDLPMESSDERSAYSHFHKELIQDGFIMMQKSIYSKLAMTPQTADLVKQRIKKIKPARGVIQILIITEKQYSQIEYLLGENQTTRADSTERLLIY